MSDSCVAMPSCDGKLESRSVFNIFPSSSFQLSTSGFCKILSGAKDVGKVFDTFPACSVEYFLNFFDLFLMSLGFFCPLSQ